MEQTKSVLKETENHSADAIEYWSKSLGIKTPIIQNDNFPNIYGNPIIHARIKKLTNQLVRTSGSDIQEMIDIQDRIERLEKWNRELKQKKIKAVFNRSVDRMKISCEITSKAFQNATKALSKVKY